METIARSHTQDSHSLGASLNPQAPAPSLETITSGKSLETYALCLTQEEPQYNTFDTLLSNVRDVHQNCSEQSRLGVQTRSSSAAGAYDCKIRLGG